MKTRNLTLNQNKTRMRGLGAWSDQSWYQHWYIQYSMEQHIGAFRLSGQSVHSPKQVHGQLGMHEWALCLWGKKKKKKPPMSVPRCKKRPHGNFRKPRSRLLMVVEISTTLTIYTHAPLTRSRLMNSSTRADYSKLFTGQVSHPAKQTKPPHHKVSIRREQKSTIRTVESPRYISYSLGSL